MTFSFPLPSAGDYIERVEGVPRDAHVHRLVLRDDNQHQVHTALSLREDPAYVELYWKADARGREQLVGRFRLHLGRLEAAEYVKPETTGGNDAVRVRFHRAERGVVHVQADDDGPALAIGTVDMTLG